MRQWKYGAGEGEEEVEERRKMEREEEEETISLFNPVLHPPPSLKPLTEMGGSTLSLGSGGQR